MFPLAFFGVDGCTAVFIDGLWRAGFDDFNHSHAGRVHNTYFRSNSAYYSVSRCKGTGGEYHGKL